MTAAESHTDGFDHETVDPASNAGNNQSWQCSDELCTVSDKKVLYVDLTGDGSLVAEINRAMADAENRATSYGALLLVLTCPRDPKCQGAMTARHYRDIASVVPSGENVERLWGVLDLPHAA